jgi:hypothetical protein
MPPPAINSGLRDNHTRGTVADFLRGEIQDGSRLSVVSAYFTIYAYDALKDCLDRIDHLDFLFGEPSFVNRLDPSKTEKNAFIIDADGLELANKLQQKRVAKECADWIERKVDIKTIKQSNLLHGKMYHIATAGVEEAILGSSNFTVRGLGLGNGDNNIELNLIVDGKRDRHLELQSMNDSAMPWRMLEYFFLLCQAYGQQPYQQALYVGDASLSMAARLTYPTLSFQYEVIDIRTLDGETLLASAALEDNLLALLCRWRTRARPSSAS